MELRKLKEKEIQPKICNIKEDGVELLLWKTALADINVLEETYGIDKISIEYPEANHCRITIDNIVKEGIGEGASKKIASTDALHRAGLMWGVGRELYGINKIFIPKKYLASFDSSKENERPTCSDLFEMMSIEYEDAHIKTMSINISYNGKQHTCIEFQVINDLATIKKVVTSLKKEEKEEVKTEETQAKVNEPAKTNEIETANRPESSEFLPDEIILIGYLKGKKYGEVKDSEQFKKLVAWAKQNGNKNYSDQAINKQFKKLLQL